MKIIFLGKPGSGKGTQAKKLANHLKIPHISTGQMFRFAYQDKTTLGIKAHDEYWGKGKLVPDDITNKLIEERLIKCKNGFILDGYPRTVNQAEFLKKLGHEIDLVIDLDVPDEVVIDRISGRRTCPRCGTNYNILTSPKPKQEGMCDKCNVELYQRDDQKPEVVKIRLKEYKDLTKPLKEFYKDKIKLVDGNKDIDSIFKDILKLVK
ncbi:adenylate kinase [Candidatus Woesearchaeota archaeon]|nr:adenylate kinase [Candidatus Woesearchaeota archaeon]